MFGRESSRPGRELGVHVYIEQLTLCHIHSRLPVMSGDFGFAWAPPTLARLAKEKTPRKMSVNCSRAPVRMIIQIKANA